MTLLLTSHLPVFVVASEELSAREIEVLSLLAMPNKAIASKLGVSKQTIKNHISNILRKLGRFGAGTDRTTALMWAIRAKLVTVDQAWAATCEDTGRTYCRLYGRRLDGRQIFAKQRVGGWATGGLWRCRELSGRLRSPWKCHFGVWNRPGGAAHHGRGVGGERVSVDLRLGDCIEVMQSL